jgi:UDP-N-acetylglucosamine acyltransferase
VITQDVLPFSITSAKRETHAYGLNKVGLQRRGFSEERLKKLHRAYRYLLAAKMNTSQAVERMKAEENGEDVKYLVEFIEKSDRGVLK